MKGSFQEVIGHRDVVAYMKRVVETGQASHAYILQGEKGSGKKLLAGLFAMSLECQGPRQEGEPCGVCKSCRQALSGNHPDIFWIRHEKPASISVDEIREQLNRDMEIKPYCSPYKIYIMPEAELMTVQAQNALLKTLEEPPSYGVILLLAENADTLLPTIRSRCVTLKLRHVEDALIRRYLMEELQVPDYQADICTSFAQGNLGRAVMLAQSESFGAIKDQVVTLLGHIHELELQELLEAVKAAQGYRMELFDYLDLLAVWYRDLLVFKAAQDPQKLIFSDQVSVMRRQAQKTSYEGIETVLQAIETAKVRLRANVNTELVLELLLLTMKEN